jgi:hypothetical protein
MRQRIALRQPEQECDACVLVAPRANEAARSIDDVDRWAFRFVAVQRDTSDQRMTPLGLLTPTVPA